MSQPNHTPQQKQTKQSESLQITPFASYITKHQMIVISLKNMIYYKQEKKSHQRVVALDSSQISKTDAPNVLRSAKTSLR